MDTRKLKIKICGLKEPDNVLAVARLNPDYLGFVFYEPSPRYVGDKSRLMKLSSSCARVGVFVDAAEDRIVETAIGFDLNAIQLHGSEPPDYCARLRRLLPKLTLIKSFGICDSFDFSSLACYCELVDFFLFDSNTLLKGGSGKAFNWSVLCRYQYSTPFFLSGGICLARLKQILPLKAKYPALRGIDVNSGFESSPGVKDLSLLQQLFTYPGLL